MNQAPSNAEFAALHAMLGQLPGLRLAILFGSLATGRETAASDLDIAVDLGHPLSPAEKRQLIEALALGSGRPVDLVDLRTAGGPVLSQILRHGRLLHGSRADYATLLVRQLVDSADFGPYRSRILEQRRRAWIGK